MVSWNGYPPRPVTAWREWTQQMAVLLWHQMAIARWAKDPSNVLPHQSDKMFSTYGIFIPNNHKAPRHTHTHRHEINTKKHPLQSNLSKILIISLFIFPLYFPKSSPATWSPATADAKRSPATAKRSTWSGRLGVGITVLVYEGNGIWLPAPKINKRPLKRDHLKKKPDRLPLFFKGSLTCFQGFLTRFAPCVFNFTVNHNRNRKG